MKPHLTQRKYPGNHSDIFYFYLFHFQCYVGSTTYDFRFTNVSQSPIFKMLHYLHVVGRAWRARSPLPPCPPHSLLCPFLQTLNIVAHWSLWLVHNADALRSRTPWRSILGSDHQSPLWDGGYHSWLQNTGSRGGGEPTEGQRSKHMNGALVDRVLASFTDRGGSFGSLCCTYLIKSIQKNPGSCDKLTNFFSLVLLFTISFLSKCFHFWASKLIYKTGK